jgi:hypothetical protein
MVVYTQCLARPYRNKCLGSGCPSSCDGPEPEEWRSRWSEKLNGFHLLADPLDAQIFAEATNRRVPEHAPFFVYGLLLSSSSDGGGLARRASESQDASCVQRAGSATPSARDQGRQGAAHQRDRFGEMVEHQVRGHPQHVEPRGLERSISARISCAAACMMGPSPAPRWARGALAASSWPARPSVAAR